MKPKKNQIFCTDCNKTKMVFETEKKALTFIKFNGEAILKEGQTIDQIRAYYCPSCCAYHITTKPYRKSYSHKTNNLIEMYMKDKANVSLLNVLKNSDEQIILDIERLAYKASITTIKGLKEVVTEYFKTHTEYNKKKEEEIRHKINLLLKDVNK